jgi:hypothetical protein
MSVLNIGPSWLDKLQQVETAPAAAVQDASTLGWRYADGQIHGFAYGDKLYRADGKTTQINSTAADGVLKWYLPAGRRDVWTQAAKLLTDRKRPELDILIAIAFAAPLTVFAGALYGPVLVVWGEPGTAKSTAQQVAAAVWGNPKQTRESLTSTPKAILRRLGLTHNLPAYWDDVQTDRQLLALYESLFLAVGGAEGGRLDTHAEFVERGQWQTMLAACANVSFVEYMTRKKYSSSAGMRRVFEIEYHRRRDEPGMINGLTASRAFAALEHNYGVIGAEYAAFLAREHDTVSKMVASTIVDFSETVQAQPDESYWTGLCGTLIAGATLARRFGAEFDVAAMRDFLLRAFAHNRKTRAVKGDLAKTNKSCEQTVIAFIKECFAGGNYIYTKIRYRLRTDVGQLTTPSADRLIHVHVARKDNTVRISKRAFRRWCETNKLHVRDTFANMKHWLAATEVHQSLGAGTSHVQKIETCIQIVMRRDGALYDVVMNHGPPGSAGSGG